MVYNKDSFLYILHLFFDPAPRRIVGACMSARAMHLLLARCSSQYGARHHIHGKEKKGSQEKEGCKEKEKITNSWSVH